MFVDFVLDYFAYGVVKATLYFLTDPHGRMMFGWIIFLLAMLAARDIVNNWEDKS